MITSHPHMTPDQLSVLARTGQRMDVVQAARHMNTARSIAPALRRPAMATVGACSTNCNQGRQCHCGELPMPTAPLYTLHRQSSFIALESEHQEPETCEIRAEVDAVYTQSMAQLRDWFARRARRLITGTVATLTIALIASALTGCGGGDDTDDGAPDSQVTCTVPRDFVGPLPADQCHVPE